jgi:hypothetical protein
VFEDTLKCGHLAMVVDPGVSLHDLLQVVDVVPLTQVPHQRRLQAEEHFFLGQNVLLSVKTFFLGQNFFLAKSILVKIHKTVMESIKTTFRFN